MKNEPKAGEIWEVAFGHDCHDLMLLVDESHGYAIECSERDTNGWDFGRIFSVSPATFIRRIEEAQ